MLPLISFETGRKTQTQSYGQPDELHQQMEVWFYPRIETAAERPKPRADEIEEFTPALLPSASGGRFCLLTRTYHRSPYSNKGLSSVFHSHVSVVKFCEVTFGLKPLNARDSASDDMSDCFDFTKTPLPPPSATTAGK